MLMVAHVVTRRAVSCYGDAEMDDFWTFYRVMCNVYCVCCVCYMCYFLK